MGFLLLQYEYQKSCANVNRYQRKLTRYNDRYTKITERIEKVTKKYEKQQTKLDNKYTKLKSAANQECQNLLAQTYDSTVSWQGMSGSYGGVLTSSVFQITKELVDGTTQTSETATGVTTNTSTAAASYRSQLQQQLQVIQDALDAELERLKTELEAEEDEEKEPLTEKETEYECEKNTAEVLLDLWTERRDNAKSRLGEEIPNSMASYGLK